MELERRKINGFATSRFAPSVPRICTSATIVNHLAAVSTPKAAHSRSSGRGYWRATKSSAPCLVTHGIIHARSLVCLLGWTRRVKREPAQITGDQHPAGFEDLRAVVLTPSPSRREALSHHSFNTLVVSIALPTCSCVRKAAHFDCSRRSTAVFL
jgi:hypothetical protein